MWRNWDCIVLYLPTINLRVNTWTIVPLASLSRPNGPWHVCCLEQHKYKSERWWIGPRYVDIDSRHKRVTVKLLQENRTQPWAVGCTEEARGRAAGINISEQEKTWLRREKQRGKDWRRMRRWGERRETEAGGERELRRERWRVTFSDGIWFSTIFPTRVTALWPTRACWDSLRPSLSFYPPVCFSFDLSSIQTHLFLSFWYFRFYDLWRLYFLQYHVIVII